MHERELWHYYVCYRLYAVWLQSVLSIPHYKGVAASAIQALLKTSTNKHINLIVFMHPLNQGRGGRYYWSSCLIVEHLGTTPQGFVLSTWDSFSEFRRSDCQREGN